MFRFPNRYSGNYTSGGRTTQLRRQAAAGSHGAPLNGNSDMSVGSIVAAQLFCPCPAPVPVPVPPTPPPPPSEDMWVARGVAQPTFSATDGADRCIIIGNWTATTADFYDASENLAQTLSAVDETQHGFIVVYNADGTCAWAARLLGEYIEMHKVCIDSANNIIVCGYFRGSEISSITAYAADGVTSLTRTRYRNNIFVARYSPAGAIDWLVDMAIAIPSSNDEVLVLADMQVYPTGEVVLCGSYSSNASITLDIFDITGSSLPIRTLPGGGGNTNLFLTKFNPTGASNFATYVGKSAFSPPAVRLNAFNVVLDGTLILLAGYGFYTVLDIHDAAGALTLSRPGDGFPINNAFLIVYDIGATPQWAATVRGNDVQLNGGVTFGLASIYARVIAVGASRYVYGGPITAAGATTFYNGDGSASAVSVTSSAPSAYIAAITTGGAQIWANLIEGTGSKPILMCLCMDSAENTYAVVYQSETTLTFYDPTGAAVATNTLVAGDARALVIVCYNPGGALQWIRQIGSASPLDFPIRIMFDTSGDLFIQGSYPFTDLHFYDGTSTLIRTLTHDGDVDGFIAKYSIVGDFKWAAAAGGANFTVTVWSEPAASGRTYTTYQYDASFIFPGPFEVKDANDTVREIRTADPGFTSYAVAKYPAAGV